MFRKFLKNKRAQNTAEYALLIALVVAGIIAMQTYAQRALQARIRDASAYMTTNGFGAETTDQYEPYYLTSAYNVQRDSSETQHLGSNRVAMETSTNRARAAGGFQTSAYNALAQGLNENF